MRGRGQRLEHRHPQARRRDDRGAADNSRAQPLGTGKARHERQCRTCGLHDEGRPGPGDHGIVNAEPHRVYGELGGPVVEERCRVEKVLLRHWQVMVYPLAELRCHEQALVERQVEFWVGYRHGGDQLAVLTKQQGYVFARVAPDRRLQPGDADALPYRGLHEVLLVAQNGSAQVGRVRVLVQLDTVVGIGAAHGS